MALPPQSQWDVTHLAAKYPWLRVDQEALEEFRSPFRWVSDASPSSPARSSGNESNDKAKGRLPRRKKWNTRSRSRGEESRPGRHGKQQRKKKQAKINTILRNHGRICTNLDQDLMNNGPSTGEFAMSSLQFQRTPLMPLLSAPTPIELFDQDGHDRSEDTEAVLEMLQQSHESLVQLRKLKKPKKCKKPSQLLALRFPVLTPTPAISAHSKTESMKRNASLTPRTLLDKYSQQIKELAEEEERLEKSVMTRIAEGKSRLPLTFLFERNLMRRSDAQQDGLRIVTAIFAKLQHRMLYNSYKRWVAFLEAVRHEDRKREALHLAQQRAVALLERVSSDAYVGTLAQGFQHWKTAIQTCRYQKAQQAVLVVQCSIRCALARRLRTRRQNAIHKLQRWVRGVYACRAAHKVLVALRIEAKRRETSVILIQKLVRQYEAQHIARVFREALNIVKIEQRRYFGSESGGIGWTTHQASSELLTYVTQRFLEDGSCFTTKELRWLRAQVQAGYDRLAREDHAAVYLQRRYRGYATRMAYWVHRLQVDEHRRLQSKKAVVIQSAARRWLAKRYVRRVREQRRLAELKEAYIRERKRKEEERLWKERYDREQMELCVQRAQEAANQLREARREADLARVKAEAAEYRAKELAAEREIETLLKTPTTKKPATNGGDGKHVEEEEEKDPWMQLTDEYGNVYYYNESTQESSWDPPPPRTKKVKTSPEEEEGKDVPSEEEKNAPTEEEKDVPSEGDKSAEEGKPKEIDPLEEVLREGKCIKCQLVPSTKRCLDCKDTKRAFYCTACFREHTRSPTEENSSIPSNVKHDFEVVPRAAVARCESGMECRVDEDNPSVSTNNQEPAEKGLAAYYCYECTPPPQNESCVNTSTESKLPGTSSINENDAAGPGCFYCESCFAHDHETATKLRHVDKALRFRRGALLCCDCGHVLAVRQCDSCGGDKFCEACFTSSHNGSKRRSMQHTWTALDVLRDLLERETDRFCVECDVRASSRLCNLCGDGFCDGCFDRTHAKGAKRRHTWLPWCVAAQHGDWIEIRDEKATVYFNVETKESTSERPNVLLSGEERHRLELAEREQLQRRRQVELESEVVKLKEQLRGLQAQDRPASPARTPTANSDDSRPNASKRDTKPAKQGVLSRLFGRKPPQRPLTPEERQRIAEDLAERVRAEKHPVGSPVFQQAMIHELAVLAVTSPQLNKPK
ncbi:uncharacterized protein KRP23_12378 [Phytophthora ramorum]|uniref:uncharacterized protein n=1 Tax=Phytophthora ramorum TaxID=164328 RepID=UPI00309840D8|nr:hypothetical protein KRP23_12378 [Phytophthora ramorum]